MDTLYATFPDTSLAQKAGAALLDHGFPKDHLSLVANVVHMGAVPGDVDAEPMDPVESAKTGISTTTSGDAAAGAATGASFGLLVGGLAALASLFIPGFGLVIGGGALATALMAAAGTTAVGAVAGGATGFLMDQGIPHEVAVDLEKAMKHGGAIIAVALGRAEDQAQAKEILNKYKASKIALQTAARLRGRLT